MLIILEDGMLTTVNGILLLSWIWMMLLVLLRTLDYRDCGRRSDPNVGKVVLLRTNLSILLWIDGGKQCII